MDNAELYKKFIGYARETAFHVCRSIPLSDRNELAHDVLARAIMLGKYRNDADFRGYINRRIKGEYMDRGSRKLKERVALEDMVEHREGYYFRQPSRPIFDHGEAWEMFTALTKRLDDNRGPRHTATNHDIACKYLWMYYFEGKNTSEIGKELGRGRNSVSASLNRTIEKLSKLFTRDEFVEML